MVWILIWIAGFCLLFNLNYPRGDIRDSDNFFALNEYEGWGDRLYITMRAITWPLWLSWSGITALKVWAVWLTGFDSVNRQRIYEKFAIIGLIGYLFISQIWDKEEEEDPRWR